MSAADAFASGLLPEDFFVDHLPGLLEPYSDGWQAFSDVDLVVGVRLEGDGGGEWTVIVSDIEMECEAGRTSTPLATVIGDATLWEPLRAEMRRWAELVDHAYDAKRDEVIPPHRRLTNARLNAMERVRGRIDLDVSGVPGHSEPLSAQIVFNAFQDAGAKRLGLSLDYADFLQAIRGDTTLKDLLASKRLMVSGDLSILMKFVGAFV